MQQPRGTPVPSRSASPAASLLRARQLLLCWWPARGPPASTVPRSTASWRHRGLTQMRVRHRQVVSCAQHPERLVADAPHDIAGRQPDPTTAADTHQNTVDAAVLDERVQCAGPRKADASRLVTRCNHAGLASDRWSGSRSRHASALVLRPLRVQPPLECPYRPVLAAYASPFSSAISASRSWRQSWSRCGASFFDSPANRSARISRNSVVQRVTASPCQWPLAACAAR